jgi:hypothetical protein
MLRKLQGNLDSAESLYQRALAVEEKVFGREHPEVATTLISQAALHRARGRGDRAVETYQRALAVLEKALGTQDPLAIEIREQLSALSRATRNSSEYQILVVRDRKEAEALRQRIGQGETFAELATRHSIDPNAPSGGYFRAQGSELRKELRAELDRLGVGQVSPVFSLSGNWAIVKKISEPAPAKQ